MAKKQQGFFAQSAAHQKFIEEQKQLSARLSAQTAERQRAAAAQQAEHETRMAEIEAGRRAHREKLDAFYAGVKDLNVAATEQYEAMEFLLTTALNKPPFRLEEFIRPAVHPPFDSGELGEPTAKPTLTAVPPEPVYQPPPEQQGLGKMFGKRQRLEAEQSARAKWQGEHSAWTTYAQETIPAHNQKVSAQYQAAEQQRIHQLASARSEYEQQCAAREETARTDAKRVEDFKALVVSNDPTAVREFIETVLESSAYPPSFLGSFEADYDAESHEATVSMYVPGPASLPKIKAYKAINLENIRETPYTQTDQRNRYNKAVAAVALRTLHELFCAEPTGIIETVSLIVGTETIDPATGLKSIFRFVAVAAAREEFVQYNLRLVDPAQTLGHLRAVVSKNPFALKPISDVRGIRK